jgi:hypothetical protein
VTDSERSRIWLKFAACGSLLAALWFFTVPDSPPFQFCGFLWLTGRPCPFCGLTRAMFGLAKGQWAGALRFNALSPLAFAMLLSLFWSGPVRNRLWTAGLGAFAAYGLARVFFPAV